jgi:hypothetical protein
MSMTLFYWRQRLGKVHVCALNLLNFESAGLPLAWKTRHPNGEGETHPKENRPSSARLLFDGLLIGFMVITPPRELINAAQN